MLAAVFAPALAPHDPTEADITKKLIPPVWMEGGTWEHPLGTDRFGRDVLSRIIYGSRISLIVSLVAIGVAGTWAPRSASCPATGAASPTPSSCG